jgi:hypothetical protein
MRSRVVAVLLLVVPSLLTAGAALAVSAAVAANDEAMTPTAAKAPPLALSAYPPTKVSLLPFFLGRRLKLIDAGLATPSSVNDTNESSSSSSSSSSFSSSSSSSSSPSSSNNSDRSVSSCSRVRRGGFRCSDGSNEAVGPLGSKGG